jgi:biopolymer transport protein ExbD
MDKTWLLKKGDMKFGPITLKTLKRWAIERRIYGKDMISNDNGNTWALAEKIPELVFLLPKDLAETEDIPRGYITKFEQKKRSFETIDMIPMIDIVFLLLLFFAVTSNPNIHSGMKMKLPAAASSSEEIKKKHTISITENNLLFLNRKQVNIQNLSKELRAALIKNKQAIVVIKADKTVQHGMVIKIMDIANKSGAKKLIVGAKKVKE